MDSDARGVSSDLQSADETVTSPQSSNFKQLTVYKAGLIHLSLCPEGSETPVFHVECRTWKPSKPYVTLHAGGDAKGPVLGVVQNMSVSGHFKVGLGDPEGGSGFGAVRWENFDRVQTWNPRHRFCCEVDRQRKWFLWRKPGGVFERAGDMQLVEDSEIGEDLTIAELDKREILVNYSRPKTAFGKKRGTFEIKEGFSEDWERTVLLTGMALVIIHRKNQGR